jgi:hypothetical protein
LPARNRNTDSLAVQPEKAKFFPAALTRWKSRWYPWKRRMDVAPKPVLTFCPAGSLVTIPTTLPRLRCPVRMNRKTQKSNGRQEGSVQWRTS